jgi:hypothetical protein
MPLLKEPEFSIHWDYKHHAPTGACLYRPTGLVCHHRALLIRSV